MVDCKKCGAELDENDEFCRKCGATVVLETFLFDKKLIIIPSFHLALGSISLYLFLNYVATYVYYSVKFHDPFDTLFQIIIILMLLASIFLISAYYGFIHQKKRLYPRFTGVIGCSLFLMSTICEIFRTVTTGSFVLGEHWFYILLPCIVLIFTLVFLFATLIFWKRLV